MATSNEISGSRSDGRYGRELFWWTVSFVISGLAALTLSGVGLVDAKPLTVEAADTEASLTVAPNHQRDKQAEVNVPKPCNAYHGHCIDVPSPVVGPPTPGPSPTTPTVPAADINCEVSGVSAVFVPASGGGYQLSYGRDGCLGAALDAATSVDASSSYAIVATGSVQFFHAFSQSHADNLVSTSFVAHFEGSSASGQSVTITISGTIAGFI